MATTPKDDKQPLKRGGKKAVPSVAPAESYLTGSEPAAEPAAEPDDAEPTADEIKRGAANFTKVMGLLGYEEKKPGRGKYADREDATRNRAQIRSVMLSYIKNEHRAATVQEICEATGLSDKTVKAHRRHIKLGDGKPNMYQHLTHDVVMAIYKKAKGFTYQGEKLLVVAGPKGDGSEVERHDITVVVHPDMGAARLWLQAVEGMSEKNETKHSGNVGGGGSFTFNYVVPTEPAADGK